MEKACTDQFSVTYSPHFSCSAESFNRIFFRNALNLGVPALECRGILDFAKTGDEIRCDIETGLIENLTQGTKIQAVPLTGLPMELIKAGGLLNYHRAELKQA